MIHLQEHPVIINLTFHMEAHFYTDPPPLHTHIRTPLVHFSDIYVNLLDDYTIMWTCQIIITMTLLFTKHDRHVLVTIT
jgi:hypothetical protein